LPKREGKREGLDQPKEIGMTKQQQYLGIGSYSEGTLKVDDLVYAFLYALDSVDHEQAEKLKAGHPERFGEEVEEDAWEDESASWFLDTLDSALNSHCAPYTFFGTSEGDGASFGVWPDLDMLREDMDAGEVLDFDQTNREDYRPGQLLAQISDHGNVELYEVNEDGATLTCLWAVV
jgi:hypothetical protein